MLVDWREAGIPEGYGFRQLLYNPPSGILIAQFCSKRTDVHKRLFYRHKDATVYVPIGDFGENTSQESPVVSLGKPILLFSLNKLTEHKDHISGDWDSLYSFDLERLALDQLLTQQTAVWPPPYKRGWVADLHAVSEDGATIFLKIGVDEPDGFAMNYFLAKMDMHTRRIQLIAPLRSVFF